MRKKGIVAAIILSLCMGLTACGGSQGTAPAETTEETAAEESGMFSAVGGWESGDGSVCLLEEGGSGILLSKLNYEGTELPEGMTLPDYVKLSTEWKEDDETITFKDSASGNEYVFQKKTESGVDSFASESIEYTRLEEEKISEYMKIAASLDFYDSGAAASSGSAGAETAEEYDPMVDVIDLTFDEGNLKYVGFEKANDALTDEDGVLLFKFEFTNEQAKPSPATSVFWIQFFQNGTELKKNMPYSSKGGDQYDLCNAYYSDAMKGGTVSFALLVQPKDDSPITVMVSRNGGRSTDPYQMMEVDLTAEAQETEEEPADEVSVEEIEELLQGTWTLGGTNRFIFDGGDLTVESNGQVLSGTYEVNQETACIDGHFDTNDGKTVTIHLPYKFDEDGRLVLMNNGNQELVKE